jgi:hypothetical protein
MSKQKSEKRLVKESKEAQPFNDLANNVQILLSTLVPLLERKELPAPEERTLPRSNPRPVSNLIVLVLLAAFILSIITVLFSAATLGAYVVFIILTIAIVITLVLLQRS